MLRAAVGNCSRGVAVHVDSTGVREFVVAARRQVRMNGARYFVAALHGNCSGGGCTVGAWGAHLGVALYRLTPSGWVLHRLDRNVTEVGQYGTSESDRIRIVTHRRSALVVAEGFSSGGGGAVTNNIHVGVTPRRLVDLGGILVAAERYIPSGLEPFAWTSTQRFRRGTGVFPDVVVRSTGTDSVDGRVVPRSMVQRFRVVGGEYQPM
ncbi:MAG: hypothetical protein ACE367_03215 [Acidimicrobiales bacterium]